MICSINLRRRLFRSELHIVANLLSSGIVKILLNTQVGVGLDAVDPALSDVNVAEHDVVNDQHNVIVQER